jgi:hypothetical protein
VLRLHGQDVAHYTWMPDLPPETSPRPYLHPVRTLAGRTVTGARPIAYPHHLGISIAVENVGGQNFWGGRTYLPGHGPAWLDNHGTQRHEQWLRRTTTEARHRLRWTDVHGSTLLREQRTVTCTPVDETAWLLTIATRLTNATARQLELRSPATQGRAGATYGGFFWHGPAIDTPAQVFSPSGIGFPAVHGSLATWVAVTPGDEAEAWSLVFVPGDGATVRDTWFVRVRHYVGIGSALSGDVPLTLAPDETITRRMLTVVVDGIVSAARAAALADAARTLP